MSFRREICSHVMTVGHFDVLRLRARGLCVLLTPCRLSLSLSTRIIAGEFPMPEAKRPGLRAVCLTRSRVIKPLLRTTSEPAEKALWHIRLTRDLFLPVHLIRR